MAGQYLQMGRLDQAEMIYRQVLAIDAGNAGAADSLSALYAQQKKLDLAVKTLQDCIAADPSNEELRSKLCPLLARQGKMPEARACFNQVLEKQPHRTDIYLRLALITDYTKRTDEVRAMERLYERRDLPDNQRRPLAYALGKVCDDLEEYDKAFGFFADGNRLARLSNTGSIESDPAGYRTLLRKFDKDFFLRHEHTGVDAESPIFLSGLARSGTTLIEQILARHPDVYAGGELMNFTNIVDEIGRAIGQAYPLGFDRLDPDVLRVKAEKYMTEMRSIAGNAAFVTNKNVANGFYLGLMNAMLPNAKLIICDRDPRDQCLSFFMQDFGNALPYYYDLRELGQRFNNYHGLMNHWQKMLPGKVHRIRYEELTAEPNRLIRALLEYCGLSFDAACLAHHEADNAVDTLSLAQVRRPINSASVGRWKKYEKHLEPLIAELDGGPFRY